MATTTKRNIGKKEEEKKYLQLQDKPISASDRSTFLFSFGPNEFVQTIKKTICKENKSFIHISKAFIFFGISQSLCK